MSKEIIAAADGSALGNPGPAGWAWYIDEGTWAAGGWPHGTNNMGELKAVLELFTATAHLPEVPLRVLCDSQYVINSITKWMPGWKKKGWKKADGKPVLNVDLMKELDAALTGRKYTFEWVKGHSGHSLNEAADERANAAAQAFAQKEEPNRGPGFDDSYCETDNAESNATEPSAEPAGGVQPGSLQLAAVERAELQLMQPTMYGSARLLTGLLAEELIWVNPAGRLLDRATVIEHRERAFSVKGTPKILHSVPLADGAVLLVSRVETARGAVLRSSTWQQGESGTWQLRFRQETAAA
ncbi:MAG: DUF4440 domain-containing protein [Rothia sp. (in: high G+C Gram-positive bacteria)]|nr:DUF4440 domain-containing protein [Rothia sp. (in: high G+C Gram-positive bacteria)]